MARIDAPACILCDGVGGAHDPACPSLVPAELLPAALSPAELDLLARRADIFLADASNRFLEKHLTRAATMALLGITRHALLPGGKDPAMTSLRATRELIQLGEEWFKAIEHREPGESGERGEEVGSPLPPRKKLSGVVPPRPLARPAPPTPAERKSRRRRV